MVRLVLSNWYSDLGLPSFSLAGVKKLFLTVSYFYILLLYSNSFSDS